MFKPIYKGSIHNRLNTNLNDKETRMSKIFKNPLTFVLVGVITVTGLFFSYKNLENGMQRVRWARIWNMILVGNDKSKNRYDIQFSEISKSTTQKSLTYLIYAKEQKNIHILDVEYLINLSTGNYWYRWGVTWNNVSNKVLGKNQFYATYSIINEKTDKSLSSGFDLRASKGKEVLNINTGKVNIGSYLRFNGPVHDGDILSIGILRKGENVVDMYVRDTKTKAEVEIKIEVPKQKDSVTNKGNGNHLLSKNFFTGPIEELHTTSHNIKLNRETFYGVKYPHSYSKLYINRSRMYQISEGYTVRIIPSNQYIFTDNKFYEETNTGNSIFSVSSTPVQLLYKNISYTAYIIKNGEQSSSKNK